MSVVGLWPGPTLTSMTNPVWFAPLFMWSPAVNRRERERA
jgi:hypothetical protein